KNLPYLAGKKITLSFTPATQADLDLINSYLPKPHADGTPIQPSELPSSLPGYLIHLKAELRVDGQIVGQGGVFTLGQELTSTMALNAPGSGWSEGEPNHPIAGEYQAIGLDMQGISASQLAALKTRMEQTKARLEQFQQNPNDLSPIQNLTKEDLSGDLLYAGILGYFASVDGSDQLTARAGKQVVSYRLPSYGVFMAAAQPHYWFGIVRNVSFPGVVMDVDRITIHTEAKDADNQKRIAYIRQIGSAASAFEHVVPERLFADPSKPITDPSQPQGVSAVKALAIAAAQGQKIYTLNDRNQAYHQTIVAGLNTDADTKQEIGNALYAGKEVTVHQADINANGWTGMGYILLDPDTGAGAYKISGGANGGWTTLLASAAVGLISLVVGLTKIYVALWLFYVLAAIVVALVIAAAIDGWDFKSYGNALDVISLSAVLPILGYFGIAGVIAGILILVVTTYLKLFAAVVRDEGMVYA
ncbi:MAG: hypothetical protein Q7T65_00240, partial [Thiobacillus sp.]|nr:hypothetical protein [Thiobacillus sp.]